MKVREMPMVMRPREKALELGIESLSDYELLAIILRSGYQGKSVVTLAQEILEIYPLNKLRNISIDEEISNKRNKQAKSVEQ